MNHTASGEVLCVTPNPALDRTLEVPGFRAGETMRAEAARVAAGGKGVNVARALSVLGARSLCMGPLGGASGRMLADLASAEGLAASWTWCDVETRSCLILVDSVAGQATVVNEAGPRVPADDWKRTCQDVLARAAGAGTICLSGSLPPGVPSEGLAELCRSLVESGHAPWVDSSGPPLSAALSARGVRLKINREEAQEVLGLRLDSVSACGAASRRLLERGPLTVVMTLGAEGAVLADAAGCWHARGAARRDRQRRGERRFVPRRSRGGVDLRARPAGGPALGGRRRYSQRPGQRRSALLPRAVRLRPGASPIVGPPEFSEIGEASPKGATTAATVLARRRSSRRVDRLRKTRS